MNSSSKHRPPAFEEIVYPWHLGKVSRTIELDGARVPHPAWRNAIFVVHGMGRQLITETAASLRSGFEDSLDEILEWQHERGIANPLHKLGEIPPPLIAEGYWADYESLEKTFPEDWKELEGNKRGFFVALWRTRLLSPFRTFGWLVRQQLRLLNPSVIWRVHFFAWLLYIPLQVVSLATLLALLIRNPKVLSDVLADVRLYVAPKGITERAIVQRIDYRVGAEFLKLIGLGWDFRPLPKTERKKISGKEVVFERIIWVAHSLGTVISYNVLSDLFHRAKGLTKSGDKIQKQGVERFRAALRRFVTIGSPLDKIAFLFGEKALRPWPPRDRQAMVAGGETVEGDHVKQWWVNFWHVLDPVSGALSNSLICGDRPPMNRHIGLFRVPGLAHVAYWKDSATLRFILGRAYGRKFLEDREFRPMPAWALTMFAVVGYLVWAATIVGTLIAFVIFIDQLPTLIKIYLGIE
ncbi:MAG: hypothetical protein WEE20_08145 [Bacteroidota bacterium]